MGKDKVLDEARRLYALGFGIHWIRPRSKVPLESGWTTGERKGWDYLEKTYRPGLNIGVRLGSASRTKTGFLAVVDVDVKSEKREHREEAVAAAFKLRDLSSAPMVASGRGNGSRHYYVETEAPFKTFTPARSTETVSVLIPSKQPSRKERERFTEKEIQDGWRLAPAWEVSLYSEGRQVVLPPSIHPDTGKEYLWKRNVTGKVPRLNVAPSAAISRPEGPPDTGHKPTATSGGPEFQFSPIVVDLAWLPLSDEVRAAIVKGTGVEDRSAYLMKASSALLSAGLSENEVLSVLTDRKTFLGECGYDHAKTQDRRRAAEWVHRFTVKKVAAERSGEGVFTHAPVPHAKLSKEERAKQDREFGETRSWKQDLDRTEKGGVRVTLKNLDLILSNEVGEKVFIEDLFASRIEYGIDTPWGGKKTAYIKDIDMVKVKRWLGDSEFGIEPNTGQILEATSLVADRCRVHPVREWLSGLKWDGISRVDTWIRDYCRGKAEEPYLSEVSRKFLLAMVKRVFEPGCQWDYVLVLEGKQGKYKSSIARALASDRWFMDNLPDLKDKDSMLNLQGKWLIELAELADVKRADYNLVKAYLIRRTDTVRPHYGRLQSDVPRQSVFIGTINEGQYLKDPTGNRRYWPVKVGKCRVKGLLKVRDQLFAEAVHIYRETNEILMLGKLASRQATDAQEDRRVDDTESEMKDALLHFLTSAAGLTFLELKEFKSRDLFVGPDAPWGRWGAEKYSANTAASILRNFGFDRKKTGGQRVWFKPKNFKLPEDLQTIENLGHPPKKGGDPGVPLPQGILGAPGHRGAPSFFGGAPPERETDRDS